MSLVIKGLFLLAGLAANLPVHAQGWHKVYVFNHIDEAKGCLLGSDTILAKEISLDNDGLERIRIYYAKGRMNFMEVINYSGNDIEKIYKFDDKLDLKKVSSYVDSLGRPIFIVESNLYKCGGPFVRCDFYPNGKLKRRLIYSEFNKVLLQIETYVYK